MPAWSGLQRVTEIDIAEVVARSFLDAVRGATTPVRLVASQ
jgi:hypothetical protein